MVYIFYIVSFYSNVFPISSFLVTTDSIYNTTTTDTCLLTDWNRNYVMNVCILYINFMKCSCILSHNQDTIFLNMIIFSFCMVCYFNRCDFPVFLIIEIYCCVKYTILLNHHLCLHTSYHPLITGLPSLRHQMRQL